MLTHDDADNLSYSDDPPVRFGYNAETAVNNAFQWQAPMQVPRKKRWRSLMAS